MTAPAAMRPTALTRPAVDFSQRPMLVFWETTGACLLACRHCRASATTQPPPGELSHAEGRALIDQVAGFGVPVSPAASSPASSPASASASASALSGAATPGAAVRLVQVPRPAGPGAPPWRPRQCRSPPHRTVEVPSTENITVRPI